MVIRTATEGGASTTASSTVALRLGQSRDLPDGGREPDLLGGRELEERGQIPGAPPRQQHVLLGVQVEREDGLGHQSER